MDEQHGIEKNQKSMHLYIVIARAGVSFFFLNESIFVEYGYNKYFRLNLFNFKA